MLIITVRAVIHGRVQGVGYRAWTVAAAKKLNLNGWVRNLRDGTVEAVFSGETIIVEKMLETCKKGPMLARVTNVERFGCGDAPKEPGFAAKPTV